MSEKPENLVLEHLKRMQTDLSSIREQNSEILRRQGQFETALARIGRDVSQVYAEQVEDRHMMDRFKERLERIERRLELTD